MEKQMETKVTVLSKQEFDRNAAMGKLEGLATVSICGNIDGEDHALENSDTNLNLRFDDIVEDELPVWLYEDGGSNVTARGITKEQARQIVDFVILNGDKDFVVHCHAGISRSGAVGSFICDLLNLDQADFHQRNRHIKPNLRVYKMLREEAQNRELL